MKIAITGLGKMGMQILERFVDDKQEVVANNRSPEKIDQAVSYGAKGAYSKEDVVKSFEGEQVVLWVMIPAEAVDQDLDDWAKLLKSGDIIIDGGNSDFRLTKQRSERLKSQGIILMDVGTSGGILGLKNGFSMMAGGDESTFKIIEPALKSLSSPHGGYKYFGESGSGHFVKMVHNGIEYGMMESLAEGYRVLKEGPYKNLDLAGAGEVWQHASVIESELNELTRQVMAENPYLDSIEGYVAESGEARWTLEVANEHNLPMPAIQASFDVRIASQQGNISFSTKLLAAMRNKFGGHALNKDE